MQVIDTYRYYIGKVSFLEDSFVIKWQTNAEGSGLIIQVGLCSKGPYSTGTTVYDVVIWHQWFYLCVYDVLLVFLRECLCANCFTVDIRFCHVILLWSALQCAHWNHVVSFDTGIVYCITKWKVTSHRPF